jgi:hypothetical protein
MSNGMTIGISGPLSASVAWENGKDASGKGDSASLARKVSVIFTDTRFGNRHATCQVIIDWGDGYKMKEVIAKKRLTKNLLISGQHIYQKRGTFQASVTIRDSEGLELTTGQKIVLPSK